MGRAIIGLILGLLLVGCSSVSTPIPTKWQNAFPSVPLSERVGGAWTGGPVGTK